MKKKNNPYLNILACIGVLIVVGSIGSLLIKTINDFRKTSVYVEIDPVFTTNWTDKSAGNVKWQDGVVTSNQVATFKVDGITYVKILQSTHIKNIRREDITDTIRHYGPVYEYFRFGAEEFPWPWSTNVQIYYVSNNFEIMQ